MRGRSEAVRSAVIAATTGVLIGVLTAVLGGSLLAVLAAGGLGVGLLYCVLAVGAVVADWTVADREDGDPGGPGDDRGPASGRDGPPR